MESVMTSVNGSNGLRRDAISPFADDGNGSMGQSGTQQPDQEAFGGSGRRPRLRIRLVALLAALGGLLGLGIVAASPASASAYGCTGYGHGVTWGGYYVKNGTFCGAINGSGTYVNYVGGNFYTHVAMDAVCNFSLKADFYDVNGNWYTWRTTGVSYRCSLASDLPSIGIYSYLRAGSVRISLMSNGSTVAAIYQSIH
jgi:hypothetical protein